MLTTIYFEGIVDGVNDPDGLNPSVAVGDTFSGRLTYSGLATPLDTNGYGRIGDYELTGEAVSASLTIEGTTIDSASPGALSFQFANDLGIALQDEYRAASTANHKFDGLTVNSFGISLYDTQGAVYPTDAFRPPMPLAEAESANFSMMLSQGYDTGSGPGPGGQTVGSTAAVTGTLSTVAIQ